MGVALFSELKPRTYTVLISTYICNQEGPWTLNIHSNFPVVVDQIWPSEYSKKVKKAKKKAEKSGADDGSDEEEDDGEVDTEGMGFMERVRVKAEAKRKALEKKALLGTGDYEKKKKEADKNDKGGDEDEDEDDDKWGKVEKAGPWTVEIDDTTGAEYYYNHDTG